MECSFRIAIWILFLVGNLQASPIGKHRQARSTDLNCNMGDIEEIDKVVCDDNMTFTSPTNVQGSCIDAALGSFIQGLELAKTNCTDAMDRIPDTLHVLKGCKHLVKAQDSTECKWESQKSRKNFTSFVNDLTSLVEQIQDRKAAN